MDVSTAFLNGVIRVPLFCGPPPGYRMKRGKVLKLLKALYGTKQGARVWNIALDDYLVKTLKFIKCPHEACIYLKRTFDDLAESVPAGMLILAIFVDDILVISGSILLINWFKTKISTKFKMTDQGELEFFLGMQVKRHFGRRKLLLNQARYHSEILNRVSLPKCNAAPAPADSKTILSKKMSPSNDEERAFVAGRLKRATNPTPLLSEAFPTQQIPHAPTSLLQSIRPRDLVPSTSRP